MEEKNIDVAEWDTLELTCVRFPKNDRWGEALAFLSLAPFVIVTAHVTLCLALMEPHVLTCLTGVLANLAVNSVLKRTVGELRPMPTHRVDDHKYISPYGMPSSHAQFIAFFLVYVELHALLELPHFWSRHAVLKGLALLLLLPLLAWLVIYGRVYLLYHSAEQVAYGTALGALIAFMWFWITQNCLRPRYPDMRKFLRMQDSRQQAQALLLQKVLGRGGEGQGRRVAVPPDDGRPHQLRGDGGPAPTSSSPPSGGGTTSRARRPASAGPGTPASSRTASTSSGGSWGGRCRRTPAGRAERSKAGTRSARTRRSWPSRASKDPRRPPSACRTNAGRASGDSSLVRPGEEFIKPLLPRFTATKV